MKVCSCLENGFKHYGGDINGDYTYHYFTSYISYICQIWQFFVYDSCLIYKKKNKKVDDLTKVVYIMGYRQTVKAQEFDSCI